LKFAIPVKVGILCFRGSEQRYITQFLEKRGFQARISIMPVSRVPIGIILRVHGRIFIIA